MAAETRQAASPFYLPQVNSIVAPKAQFQLVAVCDVVDFACPPGMFVSGFTVGVDAPLSRDPRERNC